MKQRPAMTGLPGGNDRHAASIAANALTPAPTGYPIKLVRDHTAEILNGSGEPGDLWYGPVPEGTRMRFLQLKLAEELGEYLVDGTPAELADVYAVVVALGIEHGVDLAAMVAADKRGGFLDAQMMYGRHEEFDGATDACERDAAIADLHEPDEMGVHDEYSNLIWLPRSLYPKRIDAIRWCIDFNSCHFLDVRCLSRWMRYTPEGDEELWKECEPSDPGAFRVWRLEQA